MTRNLLRQTLVALVDAKTRFVVCGGVACILQGVARATHDLGIRVGPDDDDLQHLIDAARALGMKPRVPEPMEALLDPERRRVWIEDKNAVVYTLVGPSGGFTVDVFLRYPISYLDLTGNADAFDISGRKILVSSKQHLIQAKRALDPPRKKDLRDIEDLLELIDGL